MTPRRLLFASTALVAVPLLLSRCASSMASPGPGFTTTTFPVNLQNAQAMAQEIDSAVVTDAPALIQNLGTQAQTTANVAVAALKIATAAFLGIPSNATPGQYASAFVQAVAGVVAVIPGIGPTAGFAITAGSMLIQALIAGLSSVTVTVPTTSTVASVRAGATAAKAPISIPRLDT